MSDVTYTQVTILGEDYRIAGESDGAPVPELAAYVDHKMNEVRRQSAVPDARRIAVLTSLNLADELFRERARRQVLLAQIQERIARMDSALEALGDPDGGTRRV